MSVRLPPRLLAWVAEEAERTGKKPHRVVVEAVEARRDHVGREAGTLPKPGRRMTRSSKRTTRKARA